MHTGEDWNRAYGAAELTMAIEAHPHVEQELGALPPGRGLELGCGEGRQAIWLARRGWRMTAVDFSGVAVARGRRLAAQHGVEVDWRVADVDGFVERLGALSDVTLAEPAREAAAHLPPGARFEISSGVKAWCRAVSRALTRGYLLLIDYGDLEPDIWLEHPEGTVATYRRDDATPSPLDEPGSKDITADVNFSAVARAAHSAAELHSALTGSVHRAAGSSSFRVGRCFRECFVPIRPIRLRLSGGLAAAP